MHSIYLELWATVTVCCYSTDVSRTYPTQRKEKTNTFQQNKLT